MNPVFVLYDSFRKTCFAASGRACNEEYFSVCQAHAFSISSSKYGCGKRVKKGQSSARGEEYAKKVDKTVKKGRRRGCSVMRRAIEGDLAQKEWVAGAAKESGLLGRQR
jgi:hypothetical protein